MHQPIEYPYDDIGRDYPRIAINRSSSASSSILIPKNLPIIHEILLNPASSLYSETPSSESDTLLISHGIPVCEMTSMRPLWHFIIL